MTDQQRFLTILKILEKLSVQAALDILRDLVAMILVSESVSVDSFVKELRLRVEEIETKARDIAKLRSPTTMGEA